MVWLVFFQRGTRLSPRKRGGPWCSLGGQDSTVCLAYALDAYARVETVGFDYGQRHGVEMECRQRVREEIVRRFPSWVARLGPDHVIDVASFGAISDTALTTDAEIVMLASGLPPFVPGRNLVSSPMPGARYRAAAHATAACASGLSGYPIP